MNVTFHTLTALATAAALSSRNTDQASRQLRNNHTLLLATGFVAGILMHGLLDYFPHSYLIRSSYDVIFSMILFVTVISFTKWRHRSLTGVCFLGAIFPDLVDLGPAIINSRLVWSLPTVKIFPWHWRQYSGSIYDNSRQFQSLLLHFIVVGLSAGTLYAYRETLFAFQRESL